MFCQNCGKKIPEGANFCQHCGAGLRYIDNRSTQMAAPQHTAGKKTNALLIAFLGTVAGLILLWVLGICCSPEHGILGRWQVEGDDSPEYIEFFSDGTARLEFDNTWLDEPAETVDYEITEDNQLVLSNGEESSTANFELKDDVYLVLDLYDEEETKIYRRVSE